MANANEAAEEMEGVVVSWKAEIIPDPGLIRETMERVAALLGEQHQLLPSLPPRFSYERMQPAKR